MRERKNAWERNQFAKRGKREKKRRPDLGWAWTDLTVACVAHDGDDLAKGMRERKKCLREKLIWQREEREGEKTKTWFGGCSWWWRLVWWWQLVEEHRRVSEKRELWVKEIKNEEGEETGRRTSWSENAKLIFGERRYVMGQVIRMGSIFCLILQKCHWNSILKNWKHQNPVFIFHHPHPKFWVFESWKQWSKTKPNR